MFNNKHTKLASKIMQGSAIGIDDFTPESIQFLRDVKKQYDKADTEKRKAFNERAAREYTGDRRQLMALMSCDNKVLADRDLFQPGTLDDYNMWLLEYLKQGGGITHHYDYNFNPRRWLIVNNTQKRVLLTNHRNLQFIIPKGYSFKDLHTQYDCGHATYAYGWEDGKAVASPYAWIPVYKDTIDKQILEIAHHVLGAPRSLHHDSLCGKL